MPSNTTDAQFRQRKTALLAGLQSSERDASPKGSVDAEILPLVTQLNQYNGVVTTSSCAGRMACYLEGAKVSKNPIASPDVISEQASSGGKGGGRWLYVSHKVYSFTKSSKSLVDLFDAIQFVEPTFKTNKYAYDGLSDVSASTRFVRLKFESMILHILACNLEIAQKIVTCGLKASFRESGIINVTTTPLVAIRAPGLGFDAPIGIYNEESNTIQGLMSRDSITFLIQLANARFQENVERTKMFQTYIEEAFNQTTETNINPYWEPKAERAQRLRREGLERRRQIEVESRIKEFPELGKEEDDNEPLGLFV